MDFFQRYQGHYRTLITLGVPIIIGQAGQVVLILTDTLMVGHYGTNELAAAAFVNGIMALLILISTGFSFGLTPVISGLYAQGKHQEAGGALKDGLLANVVMGVLLTVVMGMLYFFLDRLGQPDELIPLIKPYYLIQLVSLIFVVLTNAYKQFTDSITLTQISMWILLGGNALNILGNWLLIYGQLGCPELGLQGAGISTMVSRILMAVAFIVIFACHHRMAIYRKGYGLAHYSKSAFKHFNALGWPVALQMGMEGSAFNLCAIMVGWFGQPVLLAAHQVMLSISTLPYMINIGLCSAVAIRVAYFKGQNDWLSVRRSAYAGAHLVTLMVVVGSVLIYVFRRDLGELFTDDEAVVQTIMTLMLPFVLYQIGDGIQINFANALRGIADVKPMMVIAFIAYFVISLPLGYLLGFVAGWGVFGVWMAFPFALTGAAFMFWKRFKSQTDKRI